VLLVSLLLSGCSLRYTDRAGGETYVGFLWFRHFPAGDPVATHTKRVGVGVDMGANGHGLLVGYEDVLRVRPHPDTSITLDYDTEAGTSFSMLNPEEHSDVSDK
jgi:hypothetical protein